jgi:putative transcriptional regulator
MFIEMEYAVMSKPAGHILNGFRTAHTFARGDSDGGVVVHVPDNVDVRSIRADLGLSQEAFANRFGFSLAAVSDWEQQRRTPERAARVLLLVIAQDPSAVDRALAAVQIR